METRGLSFKNIPTYLPSHSLAFASHKVALHENARIAKKNQYCSHERPNHRNHYFNIQVCLSRCKCAVYVSQGTVRNMKVWVLKIRDMKVWVLKMIFPSKNIIFHTHFPLWMCIGGNLV